MPDLLSILPWLTPLSLIVGGFMGHLLSRRGQNLDAQARLTGNAVNFSQALLDRLSDLEKQVRAQGGRIIDLEGVQAALRRENAELRSIIAQQNIAYQQLYARFNALVAVVRKAISDGAIHINPELTALLDPFTFLAPVMPPPLPQTDATGAPSAFALPAEMMPAPMPGMQQQTAFMPAVPIPSSAPAPTPAPAPSAAVAVAEPPNASAAQPQPDPSPRQRPIAASAATTPAPRKASTARSKARQRPAQRKRSTRVS